MPVELWGASGTFSLGLPDRIIGYFLVLLSILAFGYLLLHYRADLRQLPLRRWLWLVILSVAAFVTAQFLPLPFSFNTPANQPPAAYLTLLALVPLLAAAVIFPPAAAMLVGAATGLGLAFGETHQLLTMFGYGFTAVCAALLIQQNYTGRVYRWLRQPVVVGMLSGLLLALLAGIVAFAAGPLTGLLALDRGLWWPEPVCGLGSLKGWLAASSSCSFCVPCLI